MSDLPLPRPASPPPSPGIGIDGATAPLGGDRRRRARERGRGLVALARARLRGAGGGRAGFFFGLALTLGFGALLVVARFAGGTDDGPLPLLATAARYLAWAVGGPVALAAANDRGSADRRDGIEALVAARGLPTPALVSARVVAAMLQGTWAIGAPLGAVTLLGVILARSPGGALVAGAMALAMVGFAIVAGVTLGGLGAACGELARRRGRWLLAAVVLGPWIVGDLAGHASWSIPGALDAALGFASRLAAPGGAA